MLIVIVVKRLFILQNLRYKHMIENLQFLKYLWNFACFYEKKKFT